MIHLAILTQNAHAHAYFDYVILGEKTKTSKIAVGF